MSLEERRAAVRRWLDHGVGAVDPEEITAAATSPAETEPTTIIAIGKAAAAMSRGAARSMGDVRGICVTNTPTEVPEAVDLLIGDHPVPGRASFEAGRRILELARSTPGPLAALISGGGSALVEHPLPGIDEQYLRMVNCRLLEVGASISETNLVRRHLSAIKGGGLARLSQSGITTYIVSDVAGAGPEVVASGPTIPVAPDPQHARQTMQRLGISVPDGVWRAMSQIPQHQPTRGEVTILADGRVAAAAVASAARSDGVDAVVADGWLTGEVERALSDFFNDARPGVTVGAGEPNVDVRGGGVGGRNSHAALVAATRIEGSDALFAAFATDGVDGRSRGAGGLVDGGTLGRGGDPGPALETSDSASYLEASGDLIHTGPTGTNVSDVWLLWLP